MSEDLLLSSVQHGLAQRASTHAQRQLGTRHKLREVAEGFEAMFLSQMFSHMFSGIRSDGMFGGGQSEQVYRSLQVEEYAKAASGSGGIGIADAVYRELLRQQEAAQGPIPTQGANP